MNNMYYRGIIVCLALMSVSSIHCASYCEGIGRLALSLTLQNQESELKELRHQKIKNPFTDEFVSTLINDSVSKLTLTIPVSKSQFDHCQSTILSALGSVYETIRNDLDDILHKRRELMHESREKLNNLKDLYSSLEGDDVCSRDKEVQDKIESFGQVFDSLKNMTKTFEKVSKQAMEFIKSQTMKNAIAELKSRNDLRFCFVQPIRKRC